MTFVFILALVAFLVAAGVLIYGFTHRSMAPILVGVAVALLGGGFLFWSTWWSNGVGEAKVMVNSVDRQIVGTIEQAGSGFKAPWVDFVDFDLFSQELVYAGGDATPDYTGGRVSGREVTVSVGGVSGGSTQAQTDMTFVYSLNADKIGDIYEEFRSQERFTEQIVSRQVLSTARQIPSQYSAIEFRGEKRGEAEQLILDSLNDKLGAYGIAFSAVTIQDVRYSENVENALTAIEQANQKAQEAEANQRTKQVENETLVASAQAEAEANRILSESLTPQVVEVRKLEALIEVSKNGDLIVDGGSGGILLNRGQTAQ